MKLAEWTGEPLITGNARIESRKLSDLMHREFYDILGYPEQYLWMHRRWRTPLEAR